MMHELRNWRKAEKITLKVLAGQVGVQASHLSEIERGQNTPSLQLAAKLSRISGVPLEAFVRPDLAEAMAE